MFQDKNHTCIDLGTKPFGKNLICKYLRNLLDVDIASRDAFVCNGTFVRLGEDYR